MTREEAKSWLRKLYARADITDEYGDMEDMQPYEEAINMAISALFENKGDLISRQAIIDRTVNRNSIWNTITDSEGNNLEDILNSIPCADVRENIHGTWEHWEGEKFFDVPICSNCGMTFSINARGWSFCPNCGADMRGEA